MYLREEKESCFFIWYKSALDVNSKNALHHIFIWYKSVLDVYSNAVHRIVSRKKKKSDDDNYVALETAL